MYPTDKCLEFRVQGLSCCQLVGHELGQLLLRLPNTIDLDRVAFEVAELKRTGQYENTLILFFQDNGGCAEGMGRGKRNCAPRRRWPRTICSPI